MINWFFHHFYYKKRYFYLSTLFFNHKTPMFFLFVFISITSPSHCALSVVRLRQPDDTSRRPRASAAPTTRRDIIDDADKTHGDHQD